MASVGLVPYPLLPTVPCISHGQRVFLIVQKAGTPERKAMKDLFDNFSQVSWWVSVVIFGLLVNLLAAYAKPLLDKLFSRYSLAHRERVQRARQYRQAVIEKMASDKILYVELKIDMIFHLITAMFLFSWLMGMLLYCLPLLFPRNKEQILLGIVPKGIFISLALLLFAIVISRFKSWLKWFGLVVAVEKRLASGIPPTAQNNPKPLPDDS